MNPARFIHTAVIKRPGESISGGKQVQPTLSTVFAALPCLAEPLRGKMLESILGRIPGAQFAFTWGTEDVRENDVVEIFGKVFRLAETIDDTHRPTGPYRTGILAEHKR